MQNSKKDYYKILGLEKSSSDDEIKSAYKKLALKWHPDRCKDQSKVQEYTDKFKDISQAYSVLSDPNKRKSYDQFGDENIDEQFEGNPFQQFHSGGGPGVRTFHFQSRGNVDENKLFEEMFGGSFHPGMFGMGGNSHKKHPHAQMRFSRSHMNDMSDDDNKQRRIIEKTLDCTLEELYTGTTKEITLKKKSGEIIQKTINLPAGIKEGAKFTFNDIIPDADVVYTLKQQQHNIFERDENGNLFCSLTINYNEALNGFEKNIKKIDGSTFTLRLSKIKSSDYIHEICNEGMPIRKGGKQIGKGNLCIKFIVTF